MSLARRHKIAPAAAAIWIALAATGCSGDPTAAHAVSGDDAVDAEVDAAGARTEAGFRGDASGDRADPSDSRAEGSESPNDGRAGDAADTGIGAAEAAAANDAPEGAREAAVSRYCGDGIRDPVLEECDDGTDISSSDACSGSCRVRDMLAAPRAPDGGLLLGHRALGDGPHSVAAGDAGLAVAYVEMSLDSPRLGISYFDSNGTPAAGPAVLNEGGSALASANPVLAALPGGRYAAAFTDFGGDGDELGIAVRLMDPAGGPTTTIHANATTAFSQLDPDILWDGQALVIAWVDGSDPDSGSDIRFRTFDGSLQATSNEETLAGTQAAEKNVVLAPATGSGWAAAWRAGQAGAASIGVRAGNSTWSIGPVPLSAADDRPALVELDPTHFLVLFTQGTDPVEAGSASTSTLAAVVIDRTSATPGALFTWEPGDLADVDAGGSPLGQSQPSAARVGSRIFVAWRAEGALGEPNGDELWLKELSWDEASGTLDLSIPAIPLPREAGHRAGNQQHAVLAATPLPPFGAIAAAWEDSAGTFGGAESSGDVAVELIPTPIVRLATE